VFSNAKSGVSAKEIERQLGVTYKTAWRILKLIREALSQSTDKLTGDVEVDEAYFGGRKKAGRDNENLGAVLKSKSVVVGAVERGGNIRAKVEPNAQTKTLGSFLKENVNKDSSRLLTDSSNRYERIARGYDRYMVSHKSGIYANKDIHINNIESFWSHVKRSMKGTHKVISKKHLQSYLDGFVFHYNNRHNDSERFSSLLGAILSSAK
jgi:transposase-like protein